MSNQEPTDTSRVGLELTRAVQTLTEAVTSLQTLIKDEYPKREEIERDFVNKYKIRRRTLQIFGAMFAAIFLSYVFTMGTISYCFLQGQGSVTQAHEACNFLPGYHSVVDYSNVRLKAYEQLIDRSLRNEKLSLDNDKRLDALEKGLKANG